LKRKSVYFCLAMFMLFLVNYPASAAEWRFPLGFTYASGISDVKDLFEDNLKAKGYIVDTGFDWPVGLSFQPYMQFENGIGVGFGFGPMMFIIVDSSYGSDDDTFFNLPINLDLRYTFMPSSKISPYVRGGLRYNIASGEYVESAKVGLFGAAGIEFARKNRIGFGFELAYDSSQIEFEKYRRVNGRLTRTTEDVEPCAFMVSVFVIF
jgi:hypothetical protein